MNSSCALLLTLSFSSFPSSWQSIIIPYLKQNVNLLICSFYCYLTPQTTELPEQTSLLTSCLLFKSAPPSAGLMHSPPRNSLILPWPLEHLYTAHYLTTISPNRNSLRLAKRTLRTNIFSFTHIC